MRPAGQSRPAPREQRGGGWFRAAPGRGDTIRGGRTGWGARRGPRPPRPRRFSARPARAHSAAGGSCAPTPPPLPPAAMTSPRPRDAQRPPLPGRCPATLPGQLCSERGRPRPPPSINDSHSRGRRSCNRCSYKECSYLDGSGTRETHDRKPDAHCLRALPRPPHSWTFSPSRHSPLPRAPRAVTSLSCAPPPPRRAALPAARAYGRGGCRQGARAGSWREPDGSGGAERGAMGGGGGGGGRR